jgi:hypothetical protein
VADRWFPAFAGTTDFFIEPNQRRRDFPLPSLSRFGFAGRDCLGGGYQMGVPLPFGRRQLLGRDAPGEVEQV